MNGKQLKKQIRQLQKENKFHYHVLHCSSPTIEKIEQSLQYLGSFQYVPSLSNIVPYMDQKCCSYATDFYMMYTTPETLPEIFPSSSPHQLLCCAFLLVHKNQENRIVEFLMVQSSMGCGGLLLDWFENQYKDQIDLIVLKSSLRAINFYQKKGFLMNRTLTNQEMWPIMIKQFHPHQEITDHHCTKVPKTWEWISIWNQWLWNIFTL